ncbi:MAG TPA: HDIG domain-containing protein [Candidatus Sumerlaeota bacterium]|nr:HDIG domain-containing protein [Candidatus Sumerlaeota bacterium]
MSGFGMTRTEAVALLDQHVTSDQLKKHCLASEVVMRRIAERLGEDAETWGLVGLLHDIDFDQTKETPEKHTIVGAEILRGRGIPEEYVRAVISHNEATPGWTPRTERLHHALACSEAVTGLVVATALVMPDRKLASVKPKSVRKRMNQAAFARNVDRGAIMECERLGVSVEDFCILAVEAMQSISDELGL